MKAIYNNEIINEDELVIDPEDRAFQYGDGLFETIIVRKNSSKLIKYHYNRLQDGASALHFHLPPYFNIRFLESGILKLKQDNRIKHTARIKLQVWRKKGGFYKPESTKSNLLITIQQYIEKERTLKNVGISESINNIYTTYSQFKTLNALKYVIASIEKEENNYDDLIILDQYGNISELLYSNIFWVKNRIFYTPSLKTGCIRGVMRSYLIEKLKKSNIPFDEVNAPPELLYKADYVLATNASGIRPIIRINDVHFRTYPDFDKIIEL